jgi:dUTP pyrophosphatase
MIKQLDPDLPAPTRARPDDGGMDLRSAESFTLGPGERRMVPTGVAVEVPAGWAGWVVPRSGLAARHGVSIVNAPGLVDAGYTGEVAVVLVNLGSEPFDVARGDRIAQLALTQVATPPLLIVEALPSEQVSARGDGGFGSSGTA